MMRAVVLGLVACLGADALRDVPKGYCYDCEVTCFEDCVVKFDREIIQPDLTGKDRLSRKDSRVEAAMKKKLHGIVLSQNGTESATTKNSTLLKLSSSYGSCLKRDRCPCPFDDAKAKKMKRTSFLQKANSSKKCAISERPCAVGCINKTLDAPPALAQTTARVNPGPSDPDDAAIPWSINVHPVKINTFATGRQNLERCFKSCLSATCGCDDAPGMAAIDDLNAAIKANDEAKDPVDDSLANWQYKKADIVDCGKGMAGKKITKDLYCDLGGGPMGYVEVCSDGFFESMGTPGDIGKKNCGNNKALLAGCLWDEGKGSCVYGLKKMVQCWTRYKDDAH
jgi:hypothetical protein